MQPDQDDSEPPPRHRPTHCAQYCCSCRALAFLVLTVASVVWLFYDYMDFGSPGCCKAHVDNEGWLVPRPLPWVISRWDGPPPFLDIAHDFEVVGSRCRRPTHIDCIMSRANTFAPWHFALAAEGLLACWSLYQRYPTLKRRLVLKGFLHFGGSPWTLDFLRKSHIQLLDDPFSTVLYEVLDSTCAVRGKLRQRQGDGWISGEMRWLSSPSDAAALHRLVVGATNDRSIDGESNVSSVKHGAHDRRSLKIGFANRRSERRMTNVDAMRAALTAVLSGDGKPYPSAAQISMEVLDDFGDLTLAGQASWVHRQDIIILPHGAGCANLMFARPCTVVLEVYPNGRYIPGEYLQLARAVGAIGYTAYEGTYGYEETVRWNRGGWAGMSRAFNMTLDVAAVARWAVHAERDRVQCHNKDNSQKTTSSTKGKGPHRPAPPLI